MADIHNQGGMPLFSSAPEPTRRRVNRPERTPDQKLDVLAAFGVGSATEQPSVPGAESSDTSASEPRTKRRRTAQRNSADQVSPAGNDEPAVGRPAVEERAAVPLLFEAPDLTPLPAKDDDDEDDATPRRRRRGGRGGRGRSRTNEDERDDEDSQDEASADPDESEEQSDTSADRKQRSQQRRNDTDDSSDEDDDGGEDDDDAGSSRRRRRRRRRDAGERARAEVTALKGSTRLEAKRQRRREGRQAGRRRQSITEAEFLARRESVDRQMVVREKDGLNQIAVLEDGILVEHYVARRTQTSMVGNVYLGRVQNVLPSMEAAFVDLGKGRNAVLYAGEVNWDTVGLDGKPKRIEQALSSGDQVMVQVTKDPIGHKGARLTSQITLAGRFLVLVPSGAMTGISRKLPEPERQRLKKLLRDIVPDGCGVIVRTAAEGATEEQLREDIDRLHKNWLKIEKKASKTKSAPMLLRGEPELAVRVVRDIFNEDFRSLIISGEEAWKTLHSYVSQMSSDLVNRMEQWDKEEDVFEHFRIDEQLSKGMDRKVWLPSGGSLVIDRTEAMTVIDVNTGRFTGKGSTLEETVTRNNIEAAEEIVRQLRLRDIGGIIVIDFIDMVLESNRDLVLRRLIECLGRDRTRHQVAEVTSLGLVQMTRKRVGQGLVEAFSEPCEHCEGRGFLVQDAPVERTDSSFNRRGRGRKPRPVETTADDDAAAQARAAVKATLATIAAAAAESHPKDEAAADRSQRSVAESGGLERQEKIEPNAWEKSRARKAKRAEETAKDDPAGESAKGKSAGDKSAQESAKDEPAAESAEDKPAGEKAAPAQEEDSAAAKNDAPARPRRRRRVVSGPQAPAETTTIPTPTPEVTSGGAAVVSSGSGAARPSRRATSSGANVPNPTEG